MILPHALFTAIFLALQILDVTSTIAALRQPDVIEVGDTAIGLGNISGWAMRRLGRWWWVIKIPFVLPFVPLLWTPVPGSAELALCFMLGIFDGYFYRLVRQNIENAKPRERTVPICRAPTRRSPPSPASKS